MRTREEHLELCKENAIEYLRSNDVTNAVISMLSDLSKHPETSKFSKVLEKLGMMYIVQQDLKGAKRWIEGFR